MQRKRKQYSIENQLRVLKLGDDYGFSIVLDNNLEGAEFMVRTLTRKEVPSPAPRLTSMP